MASLVRPLVCPLVLSMTACLGKTSRFYYESDGVDAYIYVPEIMLVPGDTIKFKFVAPTTTSSAMVMLSGVPDTYQFYFLSGVVYFDGGRFDVTIDGVPAVHGVTTHPLDGLEHHVMLTAVLPTNVTTFLAAADETFHVNFPVFDIDIQAVSGNRFYAIDDGPGATIIRDTYNVFPQELVTNSTFDVDLSNWTDTSGGLSWRWNNGMAEDYSAGPGTLDQVLSGISVGSVVEVSVTVHAVSGGNPAVSFQGTNILFFNNGDDGVTQTVRVMTTVANPRIILAGANAFWSVSEVSVRRVTSGVPVNFDDAHWISSIG